jgi:hypothetical protein
VHARKSTLVEIGECRSRLSTRYVATMTKPTSTPPCRFAHRARRGTASQIRREGFCASLRSSRRSTGKSASENSCATHDEERGGGGYDNADEHRRADSVMGPRAPQIESERGERDPDGDGLREDETLVAELRLETVEDELAECGASCQSDGARRRTGRSRACWRGESGASARAVELSLDRQRHAPDTRTIRESLQSC